MRIERHAASFRRGSHGRDAAMDQSGAQAGQAIVHARRPCLVQVAALALSAISAFSRGGDGGLGAYLANIKQLSEENIRLTREVLLRVAEIQAKLAELPERMRRIFVEVQGYQLAQQTQTALNLLQAVEESYKQRGKLRDVDRRSCEQILQTCANLTGARAPPMAWAAPQHPASPSSARSTPARTGSWADRRTSAAGSPSPTCPGSTPSWVTASSASTAL